MIVITPFPISPEFCYHLSMKRLLPLLIAFGFSLGNTGVTLGKDKTVLSCSEKDREYAKFWDNYYDPEDARNFGIKIKQFVKERSLEGLFSLVEGELTSGPRKKFIRGRDFSEIFNEKWRDKLLASDAPCSPVGWRGFMLASGAIWFDKKNDRWQIKSIIGALKENIQVSEMPIGWKTSNGLIPPQCFVRNWMSSDNFEEFESQYSIKNRKDFRKNPGKYIGSKFVRLVPITPSWGDEKLVLAAPLESCLKGSVIGGVVVKQQKIDTEISKNLIKSKICSSEISCTSYAYNILAKITRENCQNLAPNLRGRCEEAFLIAVGDYSGGSIGWDYAYNIYGLFSNVDKKKFVVPLKNFNKKNDAVNYIEKLGQ